MAPPWQHRLLLVGIALTAYVQGLAAFDCDGGATMLEENKVSTKHSILGF